MIEIWGIVIGIIAGGVGSILKDIFIKGRNSVRLSSLETSMKSMENLQSNVLLHENQIAQLSKDHSRIGQSVDALNENIGHNNQAIASLDATLKGFQNLVENIINGNLVLPGRTKSGRGR